MFNQLFLIYLAEKEMISQQQRQDILEKLKSTRIRIGTMAIEAKLMALAEVELVNQLQAIRDARFGDIAVEEGYLTKSQLEGLLSNQPKEHIVLKQIFGDSGILSVDSFDMELDSFKLYLGVSDKVFDLLQDNDIEAYIDAVAKIDPGDVVLREYASAFLKITLRLIDNGAWIQKAYKTNTLSNQYLAIQNCNGDETLTLVFSADDEKALIGLAERYSKMSFDSIDEDAQDALKEFLNCVGGMLISELSDSGKIELDIEVPELLPEVTIAEENEFTVLPVFLPYGKFNVYIIRKM